MVGLILENWAINVVLEGIIKYLCAVLTTVLIIQDMYTHARLPVCVSGLSCWITARQGTLGGQDLGLPDAWQLTSSKCKTRSSLCLKVAS
jgi:hypothetical protein